MAEHWYRRIDERDQGRRRLSRLTGWTATAAVALAGVFGLAFARHDRAAAAPVDQVTDSPGGTGGITDPQDSGDDDGQLPPPAQPPTHVRGRGGHVSSGGS